MPFRPVPFISQAFGAGLLLSVENKTNAVVGGIVTAAAEPTFFAIDTAAKLTGYGDLTATFGERQLSGLYQTFNSDPNASIGQNLYTGTIDTGKAIIQYETFRTGYNYFTNPTIENAHAFSDNLAGTSALAFGGSQWLKARQAGPVRASSGLADEIASVGPPRSRQTVSIIETHQGQTIVSGGAADLTPAQKALARQRGLVVADDLPGFHAEITGVFDAGRRGLTPTRGVTSNQVCRSGQNNCASQLSNLAGEGGFGFRLSPDGRSFEFIPPSGGR